MNIIIVYQTEKIELLCSKMKWTVRVSITKNSKPIVIANRLYMYQFWPIICY